MSSAQYGLYASAHRGKGRKAVATSKLLLIEQECPRVPRRGWAEIRRKVHEVDPLACPQSGGHMRILSFITDYAVVDRIINRLKLTFVAEKPPPPPITYQQVLMAAKTSAKYYS